MKLVMTVVSLGSGFSCILEKYALLSMQLCVDGKSRSHSLVWVRQFTNRIH